MSERSAYGPRFLIAGAALSGIAALLHVGCIVFGAPWYRALGAGEQMAKLANEGHWYPTVITSLIVGVLCVWALYALSGAGVIRRLPLVKWVLSAVTLVYLARGLAFVPLQAHFPDNSQTFWIVSSSICLVYGIVHLIGLRARWSAL